MPRSRTIQPYDASDRVAELTKLLATEREVVERLQERLRDWKPTDTSGWTHYDYAHFKTTSKGDIQTAIANAEGRIRDFERQITDAKRRHGLYDDEEDLIY